ncbi:MAG: hypothetical protein D6725_10235, partial [Planctomycetota bacterium]
SDTVELKWTFWKPVALDGPVTLLVDGLEVAGAQRQTGAVSIQVSEDVRIRRLERKERFVLPVSVRDLKSFASLRERLADGAIGQAYRFFRQPFQLTLQLTRLEPVWSVDPEYRLVMETDSGDRVRVRLTAAMAISVHRGSLSEVPVVWKDRAGWQIVRPLLEAENGDDSEARIVLAAPRKQTFVLDFQAERTFATDKLVEIDLPRLTAPVVQPARLAVITPPNVDFQLEPAPDEHVRWVNDDLAAEGEGDGALATMPFARTQVFELGPRTTHVSGHLTVHPQRIEVGHVVAVRWNDGRLSVQQTLEYFIRHVPVTQLRLRVPDALRGAVSFSVDGGAADAVSAGEPAEGSGELLRLTFNSPKLGQLTVTVLFDWPLPADARRDEGFATDIPLVGVADGIVTETVCVVEQPGPFVVEMDEERFGGNRLGPLRWSRTGETTALPLRFVPGNPATDTFHVSLAMIESRFDWSRTVRQTAVFEMQGSASTLRLRLPADSTVHSVVWDGETLSDNRIKRRSDASGVQLVLALPQPSTAHGDNPPAVGGPPELRTHVLELRYLQRLPNRASLRFPLAGLTLEPPRFEQRIATTQVTWSIVLPPNRRLFSFADEWTPDFAWRRVGLFWYRLPVYGLGEVWQQLQPPQSTAGTGVSNRYTLVAWGRLPALRFQAVGDGLLVVLGAGASLLVALLLTRVTVFQHAVALLGLGTCVALLHLVFPQQIELLLQPAAAGLLLAILAVLVEHRLTNVPDFPSPPASALQGSGSPGPQAAWDVAMLPGATPSSQASAEAIPR